MAALFTAFYYVLNLIYSLSPADFQTDFDWINILNDNYNGITYCLIGFASVGKIVFYIIHSLTKEGASQYYSTKKDINDIRNYFQGNVESLPEDKSKITKKLSSDVAGVHIKTHQEDAPLGDDDNKSA